MDELLFRMIALETQKDFGAAGLVDGIYYDFALEVAKRYFSKITMDWTSAKSELPDFDGLVWAIDSEEWPYVASYCHDGKWYEQKEQTEVNIVWWKYIRTPAQ